MLKTLPLTLTTHPSATSQHIPYTLVRSKRKNLTAYVRHGYIEIRAPLRAPQTWIDAFLTERASWFLKKLHEHPPSPWCFSSAQLIPYLGKTYATQYKPALFSAITLTDTAFIFHGQDFSPAALATLFKSWLMQQAQNHIPAFVHAYAQQINQHTKIKAIRFKFTKSAWGHCTASGTLQFNPFIMLADPATLNYVIAHEVCHLNHMNRSPAFWQCVATLCPDYLQRRKILRSLESPLLALDALIHNPIKKGA